MDTNELCLLSSNDAPVSRLNCMPPRLAYGSAAQVLELLREGFEAIHKSSSMPSFGEWDM